MEWTPNAPHVLVGADHVLAADLPVLLAGTLHQDAGLLVDVGRLQVAHADDLFPAVDVFRPDHRVSVWTRRDVEFDLWGLGDEAGEEGGGEVGTVI